MIKYRKLYTKEFGPKYRTYEDKMHFFSVWTNPTRFVFLFSVNITGRKEIYRKIEVQFLFLVFTFFFNYMV